jgi:hypothetical protein
VLRRPALDLRELSEREWQQQVVQLAQQTGWRKAFHVYDSRRSHSGWPDLVLLRERLVLIELKTERGKLSDAQRDWLNALRKAGVEAYVARPRDLEALADLLTSRLAGYRNELELHTQIALEAVA